MKKYIVKHQHVTFDGIKVFFSKDKFDHAFFESTKRNGVKDTF